MLFCSSLVALLLLTVVMSQPLFFLLAFGRASLALSASAYVELRQRINSIIETPLKLLYLAALAACAALALVAYAHDARPLAVSSSVAVLGIALDLLLAVTCNVPMNREVGTWSASAPPSHWQEVRARWHQTFRIRQVVLSVAFLSLCVGVLAARG